MYGIGPDIFLSVLRSLLMALGTFMAAKGWISSDISGQLAGSLVAFVSVAFSAFFHASSNGTIATLSTTSNASPNVETRTVVVAAQAATATEPAKPATASTTVTATKPEPVTLTK